jgi:hypothetical protein
VNNKKVRRVHWGDNTKVRKLSGSRSYGDVRALSNSSLFRHDFKGARRRQSIAKPCVVEIRRSSRRFSPWRDDQIVVKCPPRCLPLSQSARIHSKRLKLFKRGSLEPDDSDTFVSLPRKRRGSIFVRLIDGLNTRLLCIIF